MTIDFTKFPYPALEDPHARTLTEAIAAAPNAYGYVVITIKTKEGVDLLAQIRGFAQAVRGDAAQSGIRDVTAYREITTDELGGAMPFDQAICDAMLEDVKRRAANESTRFPASKMAIGVMSQNEMADWIILAEFGTPDQATAFANGSTGNMALSALLEQTASHSMNAFRNTKRYASVSRDPNVVHFFNLFRGPGDIDVLWSAWQEALPWFLEVAEFRSSLPLVALDARQPLLIVNYAHVDSVKHFLHGVAYDPVFLETITHCYLDRGFKVPLPFFCKIVPI